MPPKRSRRESLIPPQSSVITNFFSRVPSVSTNALLTPKILTPKIEIISSDDESPSIYQPEVAINLTKVQPQAKHEISTKSINIFKAVKNNRSIKNKKPVTPKKRIPKVAPPYKTIQGTTFAVDAFQFGSIEGVSHYFLTHFHADHHIGLTKKFPHPIYCGQVTGALVQKFISESLDIRTVDIGSPVSVDGVEITAIDANQ